MPSEFKDLLLVLDGLDTRAEDLRAGVILRLAHHHGAAIRGLFVGRSDCEPPSSDANRAFSSAAAARLAGIADEASSGRPARLSASEELYLEASSGPGSWDRAGSLDAVLCAARSADLVIAGHRSADRTAEEWFHPDQLVLGSGRPCLLVPDAFAHLRSAEEPFGSRILIAWNGSAQASCATHDALPFLRKAKEVVLLWMHRQADAPHRLQALAMAEHLERHGVPVRMELVVHGLDFSPADLVLRHLSELGSDLLVMGSFSRTHLHESWFRGTSERLITDMRVPVLTSH